MKLLSLSQVARGGIALAAVALVSLGVHANGASAAAASPTVTAAVGLPGVGAPSGTTFDLSSVGYQASEFFVSGTANSYHNALPTPSPLPVDGVWTIAADAVQPAYNTRIQVYRPIDPLAFDGTVFVEWLNATNQSDSAPDWIYSHVEMIREGAVYVGVTAQRVSVNAAIAREPARYGPTGANLVHPGDSFSYDIFSQAGQAILDDPALVLGGLTPTKLIATGESQSASRMVTYIDAIDPLVNVYDGYLVHSRGSAGSQLRSTSATPPLTAINVLGPTLIRADQGVLPVFVFQTETDTRASRQADTSIFRQWEVAGTAHADIYTLGIGQPDTGLDNTAARQLFDAMLVPVAEPLPGILPPCIFGVNSGPHHWVLQAAVRWLNLWVANGTLPPSGGPGLTTTAIPGSPPLFGLVLDSNGNATGGVRSPHVDVPVATIRGTGNSAPGPFNFCGLFGTTTAFSAAQLAALYPNHGMFVSAWAQSVNDGVAGGFILPEDAEMLKAVAAESRVGQRPSPRGMLSR
jgi:hypothetical protein